MLPATIVAGEARINTMYPLNNRLNTFGTED